MRANEGISFFVGWRIGWRRFEKVSSGKGGEVRSFANSASLSSLE